MEATSEIRLDEYRQKLDTQNAELKQAAARWGWMAYVRGGLFLASLVPIFLGLASYLGYQTPWFGLAGLLFFAFLAVAFFHENMQARYRVGTLRSKMYRESIARIERDWDKIKVPYVEVPEHQTALAKDLDLIGPSSLFKLLGIVRTPLGVDKLSDWILNPTVPEEIVKRQEAVRELSQQQEWREKYQLKCESLAASQTGPSQFVEWCESEDYLDKNNWLLQVSRVLAGISLLAVIATLTAILPLTMTGPVLMVTVGLTFLLSVLYAGSVHEEFNMISTRHHEITYYQELMDMMSEFPSQSGKLTEIQTNLFGDNDDVRSQMKTLGRYVWLANWRRDGVFFLLYLIVQFTGFWDVHILSLLEKWKRKHGSKARNWFDNMGQWESLCAMGKLAHDQPDWTFPKVSNDEQIIKTKQLGHPLLSNQDRVDNDCQVGPPGTVLLVTGSNMSGKSTLLRSVGLNSAMAQMGCVVCAAEMSLPSLQIATSMRISDSLADGVSFFMAELKRLKEIVDHAERAKADQDWNLLFLLDEILQGTNSRERQIAVSRVVKRLIDGKAIGCISTHDLDLARTEDLRNSCTTVHFCEDFVEVDGVKRMTFDYQMHEGISPTTNALKLLEMVGLGEPSS